MPASPASRDEAKKWWLRCISCSEASMTQHNRSFGVEESDREQSAGLLSGGVLHRGDVCGLLHGAVLAAGVQARTRFPDDDGLATSSALSAAIRLVREFKEVSGATDCRDITELDFTKLADRVQYLRSGKSRTCGRLSLSWVEKGHDIIDDVLDRCEEAPPSPCHSCVVDAAYRIGVLDRSDAVHLAGCSGGVGLSGNVCGVFATGVFAIGVRHYERRGAKKRDTWFVSTLHESGFQVGIRKTANQFRRAFEARFGSRLCTDVAGRRFADAADYSAFVSGGGCREVIDFTVEQMESLG